MSYMQKTISSSAIRHQRISVKFIYIQRFSLSTCNYDIGLLDDKYNFYQEHVNIQCEAITPYVCNKLNKLFNKYLITKDTEIDFLDTIKTTDVIYMYLQIRNQAVFANMRFLNIDMIPRRIVSYHHSYLGKYIPASHITRYYVERLWKKLVELEKCPWITAQVNALLDNMSSAMRKREVVLRMAMYYMIVKRALVRNCIKSRDKKIALQNSTIQQ